jgi:siderophore synthetase component
MHVIDRVSAQEISFSEQYKLYSNTFNFSINESISEVNKHSLKQLLLAFLREDILPYHYQNATVIFDLKRSNYFMYVTNVKLFSLLRFTHFDSLILKHKSTSLKQTITDPLKLLDIVKNELESILNMDQWVKFCKEIANHLQNALLSNWKKYSWSKLIDRNKKNSHHQLNTLLKSPQITINGSLQFEQSVFSGHPYHPCAKTKLGFSVEDVFSYSPEFNPQVSIILGAVHKKFLHIEKEKEKPDFVDFFSRYYPDIFEKWSIKIKNLDLNLNDYVPFPVHPWQARRIIPNLFSDYFKEKIIFLFENITIDMTPTLSFRTLAPVKYPYAPYIKLPVAIQATSDIRTLTNASTENTPKITCLLEEILLKENYFSQRLFILPEYYGLHLKGIGEDKARNFTAIFRENINNYLGKNEVAITIASLFEDLYPEKINLFISLLQLAGFFTKQDALNYFNKYVDLVLGSYLDLYLVYGISLEGHQQNTMAIFENGQIKRFIARDLDGTRILAEVFKAHKLKMSNFITEPLRDKIHVRNLLLHTVYQLHLGELVLLLAKYYNCEDIFFWEIVRKVTECRFNKLKDKMNSDRWKTEYHAILQADWPVKALMSMRLEKQHRQGGIFGQIVNPLNLK